MCLLSLVQALIPACASVSIPLARLESPEAAGPRRFGRLEAVGWSAGPSLTAQPTQAPPDAETGEQPGPALQLDPAQTRFGFVVSPTDSFEAGFRVHPGGPLQLRAKYQFFGNPESRADRGNLSLAVVGGPGFMVRTTEVSTLLFWTMDATVLAGWRPLRSHLLIGSLGLTLAGLSGPGADRGTPTLLGDPTDPTASTGASAIVPALGYQWSEEDLWFRAELGYALGASGPDSLSGPVPGVLIGLNL
jgi:hypothetical protein